MPARRSLIVAAALILASLVAGPAAAREPSVDDVYRAAASGNLKGAQQMMQEVLRAHPNSAKAHYVEAELLAREGQSSAARSELARAEALEPGLPFAKPQSVQELKARIGRASGASPAPAALGMFPWGSVLMGILVIAAATMAIRALSRRAAAPTVLQPGAGTPYTANPMGSVPMSGGGSMGSSILGGLATGAAVGAGMVAGEALAHRIGEGLSGSRGGTEHWMDHGTALDDLGGSDFGIADDSGWDDSSSGGDFGGDPGDSGGW